MDAEFFQHRHLVIERKLGANHHDTIAGVAAVSDGNHFSISESFVDEGVPYYRGQDAVGHFFIEQANPNRITRKAFVQPFMRRSHLKQGDVLLSIVGTVGETSLVQTKQDATCSCKLAILRPNGIKPAYLATYLSSVVGRSLTERWKRGAVQTGLLLEDMDQLPVPRFSNGFEEKIAAVVNDAYKTQIAAEKAIEEAETTLLHALGLDDWKTPDPLTYVRSSHEVFATGRFDAEFFSPATHAILDELSRTGDIALGDVCEVTTGFPWKSDQFIENGGGSGEAFVRIRNCKPGAIWASDLDMLESRYATTERQSKATPGDLVVGMDGLKWFYASILMDSCYVNQRVAWLKPSNMTYPSGYLLTVINTLVGQQQLLSRMTIAQTVGHITLEDLRNLRVPTLNPEVRAQIAEKVDSAISSKQRASSLLDAAKRAVEIAIEQDETAALNYLERIG